MQRSRDLSYPSYRSYLSYDDGLGHLPSNEPRHARSEQQERARFWHGGRCLRHQERLEVVVAPADSWILAGEIAADDRDVRVEPVSGLVATVVQDANAIVRTVWKRRFGVEPPGDQDVKEAGPRIRARRRRVDLKVHAVDAIEHHAGIAREAAQTRGNRALVRQRIRHADIERPVNAGEVEDELIGTKVEIGGRSAGVRAARRGR